MPRTARALATIVRRPAASVIFVLVVVIIVIVVVSVSSRRGWNHDRRRCHHRWRRCHNRGRWGHNRGRRNDRRRGDRRCASRLRGIRRRVRPRDGRRRAGARGRRTGSTRRWPRRAARSFRPAVRAGGARPTRRRSGSSRARRGKRNRPCAWRRAQVRDIAGRRNRWGRRRLVWSVQLATERHSTVGISGRDRRDGGRPHLRGPGPNVGGDRKGATTDRKDRGGQHRAPLRRASGSGCGARRGGKRRPTGPQPGRRLLLPQCRHFPKTYRRDRTLSNP